ncbi:MAG: DinB family protein [Candidatus Bathyarchaeota archaeon]|nr:DinB family protein [Candidatus Bathyarchaeota archaeon]
MQVADLIRYNHIVRKSYLDAFAKLPWSEVAVNRGLSWDSMRDVFVHLTLVEDRWVNYIIPGRFEEWADPDFSSFTCLEDLRVYMKRVHAATDTYLLKLSAEDLERKIEVPWGEPPYTKLPVEAVLTHMVLEDMVHYGELSAALWGMGQQAPYRAYWRFKTQDR